MERNQYGGEDCNFWSLVLHKKSTDIQYADLQGGHHYAHWISLVPNKNFNHVQKTRHGNESEFLRKKQNKYRYHDSKKIDYNSVQSVDVDCAIQKNLTAHKSQNIDDNQNENGNRRENPQSENRLLVVQKIFHNSILYPIK